jgi:hypothetical protein
VHNTDMPRFWDNEMQPMPARIREFKGCVTRRAITFDLCKRKDGWMALECAYARGYWSIYIESKKTSSFISRMACEGRAEDIRQLSGAVSQRDQWAEGRRVENE